MRKLATLEFTESCPPCLMTWLRGQLEKGSIAPRTMSPPQDMLFEVQREVIRQLYFTSSKEGTTGRYIVTVSAPQKNSKLRRNLAYAKYWTADEVDEHPEQTYTVLVTRLHSPWRHYIATYGKGEVQIRGKDKYVILDNER